MLTSRKIHAQCVLWVLVAGPALGLGGCLDKGTTDQMARDNSILAPLFHRETPADAAAWASDPYDADKRARGTLLLANSPFGGEESYLNLYRDHLKDASPEVQAVAARALGMHGSPEDVPLLLPLTNSKDRMVRLDATRSLQRLYNASAVPALIARLDPDQEQVAEIRAEAASALGQYATRQSLEALIAALADQSLLVNVTAHDSLKTLTGNLQLPADRKAWVEWEKSSSDPFAGRTAYVYPVFWREKHWYEYAPFMPPVPNEIASTPVGFPDIGDSTGKQASSAGASGTSQN